MYRFDFWTDVVDGDYSACKKASLDTFTMIGDGEGRYVLAEDALAELHKCREAAYRDIADAIVRAGKAHE